MTKSRLVVRTFVNHVNRAAGPDARVDLEPLSYESSGVQDSIDALVSGLEIFAAIVAVAALIAIGQAIGRQVFVVASDDEIHRAMGLRPRERLAGLAAPFVAAGVAGVSAVGSAAAAA